MILSSSTLIKSTLTRCSPLPLFHNNGPLKIQEAGSTSITSQIWVQCNKYVNEEKPVSRSSEISAGGEGGGVEGGPVLIAHGQRNPITVGIDYKIVCVNDFHAESGLPSLQQNVKKESN